MHFAVRVDIYPELKLIALCGYSSENVKEFENGRNFLKASSDKVDCKVCLSKINPIEYE